MSNHLYISDSHFGHRNIIGYCDRPFHSVSEMDGRMARLLLAAEERGRVFHLGDLTLDPPDRFFQRQGALFRDPSRHVLVAGNHDSVVGHRPAYAPLFGEVVGTEETWRENVRFVEDRARGRRYTLLLSHAPQEDLRGADLNLYGHHHNHFSRPPEEQHRPPPDWLRPGRYINVSCELLDYRPRTLEELFWLRDQGHVLL